MPLLMGNQGEGIWLQMLANKVAPQNLVVKLFKNDYTPVDGSTEANFTEADFTGYAAYVTDPDDWTVTPGAPSLLAHPQIFFESSANQTQQDMYGYYVVQETSGKYMWGERFDASTRIKNNGDGQKVTPQFQLKKEGE